MLQNNSLHRADPSINKEITAEEIMILTTVTFLHFLAVRAKKVCVH